MGFIVSPIVDFSNIMFYYLHIITDSSINLKRCIFWISSKSDAYHFISCKVIWK